MNTSKLYNCPFGSNKFYAAVFPKRFSPPGQATNVQAEVERQDRYFLQTLKGLIEDQIDNSDLSFKELCAATFTSHTQLFRRIKSLTGKNPTIFIRIIRLEKAREMLQKTDKPVCEIAYSMGFSDPNYFSRVFSRHFGLPPSNYRTN